MKHCRTDVGYAHLKSVVTKEKSDAMQSFVFAETFKYFYLLVRHRKDAGFQERRFQHRSPSDQEDLEIFSGKGQIAKKKALAKTEKKILITGGTGFLGADIVRQLLDAGEKNLRVMASSVPAWMTDAGVEAVAGP